MRLSVSSSRDHLAVLCQAALGVSSSHSSDDPFMSRDSRKPLRILPGVPSGENTTSSLSSPDFSLSEPDAFDDDAVDSALKRQGLPDELEVLVGDTRADLSLRKPSDVSESESEDMAPRLSLGDFSLREKLFLDSEGSLDDAFRSMHSDSDSEMPYERKIRRDKTRMLAAAAVSDYSLSSSSESEGEKWERRQNQIRRLAKLLSVS